MLSDFLGEVPTSSAVSHTPQLMDDELPVLPSSTNKPSSLVSVRTVNSSVVHASQPPSSYRTSSSRTSNPHSTSGNSVPSYHVHGSGGSGGVVVQAHSNAATSYSHSVANHVHAPHSHSHSHSYAAMGVVDDSMDVSVRHGGNKLSRGNIGFKRRRWSNEHGSPVV